MSNYNGPLIINGVVFEAEKSEGIWAIKSDFDKLREFIKQLSKHEDYLCQHGFDNIMGMNWVIDSLEKKYLRRGKRVGNQSLKEKISRVIKSGMSYSSFTRAFKEAFPQDVVPKRTTFYKYRPK